MDDFEFYDTVDVRSAWRVLFENRMIRRDEVST